MGSHSRENVQQGSGWWTRKTNIRVWINQEEQLGSKTNHTTQGSSMGKQSLKTSGYKNLWGLWLREKLLVSQESPLEGPMGSSTNPPTLGIITRRAQFTCE